MDVKRKIVVFEGEPETVADFQEHYMKMGYYTIAMENETASAPASVVMQKRERSN